MEAEKGTGEGTLFQNSKAICFFKLASLLFPASLSQALTCIFSISSFAFLKSRHKEGKNIKDSNLRNSPNPPHVLREPDLLVSHSLSLPPSPTQTLPSPAPSSGHLNLSTEQRVGRLLTRTPPRQAQLKSIPLRDHLFFPWDPALPPPGRRLLPSQSQLCSLEEPPDPAPGISQVLLAF